jgi:2Fe-2S ferredoxin
MLPEVTFLPDQKKIRVKPGTPVLGAAKSARVVIRSRCGGNASCMMCKVIVRDQSGLSPMKMNEERKLGNLKDENYRLACQARVVRPVTVEIPEDPLKSAIRAQLEKQKQDDGR